MSRARAVTPGEVPHFDVVEAVTPVGTAPCAECRAPIVDSYYEWDGKVICATCQPRIAAALTSARTGSMTRALGLGLVAAVLGAALYYGINAVTRREFAVTLILVGFAIGKAVRLGSGGRGGRRYQWLAAGLTYLAIASTYVPFLTSGFGDRSPALALAASSSVTEGPSASGASAASSLPAAGVATIPSSRPTMAHLAALLLLATAAPMLAGFSNITGIAITIIAVLVAWRVNRPLVETIAGPFQVVMSR